MSEEWMPGAEIRRGHGGGDMVGGVAKALHHITWDALHSDGTRIVSASGIADYLISKGYEPHFVIDPFTGQIIQLMAASRGASALAHPSGAPQTNNSGTCNIQVEWLFTPGTVYDGHRFDSLLDTPMLGLEQFLAFTDSWGVPRVAPEPDGGRDVNTWQNVAGHYGHFNAPSNDHSDPQCSIQGILNHSVIIRPPAEDQMFSTALAYPCVMLTNLHNRKVFDVQGKVENGAKVGTYMADGQLDQRIMFIVQPPSEEVCLVLGGGKFSLDSPGEGVVHVWERQDDNANQRWLVQWEKGLVMIRHAHRKGVLSLDRDTDGDTTGLILYPESNDPIQRMNQLFMFSDCI